jgi:PTH1 family peptidyl-tRNA hydrolase
MTPRFRLFGRPKAGSPVEWLIVGLGNPGHSYRNNRHNAGFQVVDRLAASRGLHFDVRRNQALLAQGRIEDVRVTLVKPQTYMNRSGVAVAGVARFFKVPAGRVLLIFDDLDLPLGSLRLRLSGGAGGHRGMTDVIAHLNTRDFPRVRIGIGRPPGQMPPEAYVLQDFRKDELPVMQQTYQKALDAIDLALKDGFELAMNQFN